MSTILERVILEQLPRARQVYIEGEYAFVLLDGDETVTRYRLSPEAQRVALLEREGRFKDIQPGEVMLLPPGDEGE